MIFIITKIQLPTRISDLFGFPGRCCALKAFGEELKLLTNVISNPFPRLFVMLLFPLTDIFYSLHSLAQV